MPIEKIITEGRRSWALWRITETENNLYALLRHPESIPDTISNPQKRLEWIAGRVITQRLLEEFSLPYLGTVKDEYGKPFPVNYPFHLSLSHSYPHVAAILDMDHPVGIDLEQPKEKLLRVGRRVLSPSELKDAGNEALKHCIYWCAKETLIKIYGKKDLVLAENLQIDPFPLQEEGYILGKIIVFHQQSMIPLYYRVYPDFVLTFSLPEKNNVSEPDA